VTILSQYYDGKFPQVLLLPKLHYSTLFFDGAILQSSAHVFALVAAT
jgi:hypothetical protein